jgi:Uma2 family endonuclease
MTTDPRYRKITADEFLAMDFGSDKRLELVDGVIVAMTGGTEPHSRVAGNILYFLRQALRGSGCRAYGSDMGIKTNETTTRYPDVTVFCGKPYRPENADARTLEDPKIIFEILSPSTAEFDQGTKLYEYEQLESLDMIVFVDAHAETVRVSQRIGPNAWRNELKGVPVDVVLPSLGITIPKEEIFARD